MVLELGFAHACSTLYMLQALADNEKGMLISVDPLRLTHYKGGAKKRGTFGSSAFPQIYQQQFAVSSSATTIAAIQM